MTTEEAFRIVHKKCWFPVNALAMVGQENPAIEEALRIVLTAAAESIGKTEAEIMSVAE